MMASCGIIAAGCSADSRTAPVISDSAFVAVMIDLVKLKNPSDSDTVYYAERRREALERHKVTLQDLERKGLRLAEDPAHATKVWGEVQKKIGSGRN
jgi:hypothetical protein